MIEKHIRRTKFHFSIGIILLLATIISGILNFKQIPYFSYDYIEKQLRYIKYKHIIATSDIKTYVNSNKAEAVPVLVYHGLVKNRVGEEYDDSQSGESINITPEDFFDQMLSLKRAGWKTISIYDFNDFMQGRKELPEKVFLLTFDDGRKDSYYQADPILEALDFRATMFVITGRSLDSSNKNSFFLSKEELKSMEKSGRWDLQSHGKLDHELYEVDENHNHGHFLSNKLWIEEKQSMETQEEFSQRIRNDLTASKNDIETDFGINVVAFAYPFSDFGEHSLNSSDLEPLVSSAVHSVYPLAFYQISSQNGAGFNYPFDDDKLFMVKRIKFSSQMTGSSLIAYLNASSPKRLPFNDDFKENHGWYKIWGDVSIANGALIMKSDDTTTGSGAFLDGTRALSDYYFQADIHWEKGSNVSLLARYRDDNSIRCNFSNSSIKIEKVLGENRMVIHEVKRRMDTKGEDVQLGINVSGNSISCLVGDKIVAQSKFDDIQVGGVAIQTWDERKGNSSILVKDVHIARETDKTVRLVDPASLKELPYTENQFDQDSGWIATWGKRDFSPNGSMSLSAIEDSTGASAFLGGSQEWEDYAFSTDFKWEKGQTVSLLARYRDNKNYVAFTLSNEYSRIEIFHDGERTIVKEIRNSLSLQGKDVIVQLDVQGERVSGFIGDNMVISADIPEEQDIRRGGIGLKIWDAERNNSLIEVQHVSVESL